MEKKHYRQSRLALAMIVSVILGLSACSDELPDVLTPDSGKIPLEFGATIDQDNSSRADDSGFADNDRFGVFVVNYRDGQPGILTTSSNQVDNVAIRYNADSNTWTPATDIYWLDDQTPTDVYGYYPFNNALSDVDSYNFEVSRDQSIPAADGEMGSYEASDFLWAKTPAAKPGKKVNLSFGHALAGVKVVLQKGSGFDCDEWERLPKIVTVDNTVRTARVNLSTGAVTPAGSYDRNIVMNTEGEAWRAVVVPQSITAGKSTIGVTIDGVANNLIREGEITYSPGKLHVFTIEVNRKSATGDFTLSLVNEEIAPWECDESSHDFETSSYLVVDVPKEGTLKECLAALCDPATIRNLKVIGRLTEEDFIFMREGIKQLKSLNLKSVKIVHVKDRGVWADRYVDDKIPDGAFSETGLSRIVLPDNLEIIGEGSFGRNTFQSTVFIPNSVKVIENFAFWFTSGDFEIVLPDNLEVIDYSAFSSSAASIELKFPHTLKYIGDWAFYGCRNAYGTFSLPPNLEYLGENAFYTCGTDLDGEIVIPEKIKEIPLGAFASMGFRKAVSLTLHDGVTRIGDYGFSGLSFSSPIVFPKRLRAIGSSAFGNCKFSGDVRLPSGLMVIGAGAFFGTNIKGELELPAGIEVIEGTPFYGNQIEKLIIGDNTEQIDGGVIISSALRYVEIGKNMAYIAGGAFSSCKNIEMIVCFAKEPPTLDYYTFTAIDFEHCVLEVPEASVEKYRNAPSWSRFRNITPHRELNISLSRISCLNKGITRNLILTAEGDWEIAESPSWIHVTPDHAAHKEEITVKVDPLPTGYGDREGKVIFRLKDSGYTNYITVKQYDYEYEEDKEIVFQTATGRGMPVPVYIVGEGYGAQSIADGTYMQRVSETIEHLFAIEPYKTYRGMFRVSAVIAMSPDNGARDIYSPNHTKFSMMFPDIGEAEAAAIRSYISGITGGNDRDAISRSLIIVLSNYESFGGSALHSDPYGCTIACIGMSKEVYPYDYRGLVQSVAGGEAFGGLATETINHQEFLKECTCPMCQDAETYRKMKSLGLFENISTSARIEDCPWLTFMFHDKYSTMVDMYEGGLRHLRGVWRSERESVMNTCIPYYNTISRYAIYKQIMKRAGLPCSTEDFIANDKIDIPQ